MAVLDTPRAAYLGIGRADRLAQTVHSLFTSLINWNDARVTRKALSKLSDRELDDIGLCRGDIADFR